MRRIGILISLLAVTAAACGSSSGSGAGPNAPDPPQESTTTAPEKLTGDAAIVGAGLIQPSDLPSFTSTPAATDASSDFDALAKGVPGCEHFVATRRTGSDKRRSPRFQRDAMRADSSVDAYPSEAALTAQLDLYHDPTTLPCLRDVVQKGLTDRLGATAAIESVDISPIAVDELGDGQFAYRFTVTIDESGSTTKLLFDIVGLAVGRFALSFNPQGTTEQLAQLESNLLPTLVKRMRRAGA